MASPGWDQTKPFCKLRAPTWKLPTAPSSFAWGCQAPWLFLPAASAQINSQFLSPLSGQDLLLQWGVVESEALSRVGHAGKSLGHNVCRQQDKQLILCWFSCPWALRAVGWPLCLLGESVGFSLTPYRLLQALRKLRDSLSYCLPWSLHHTKSSVSLNTGLRRPSMNRLPNANKQ